MNTLIPYGVACIVALAALAQCVTTTATENDDDDNEGFCALDGEEECNSPLERESTSFLLKQVQFDMEVGEIHELPIAEGRSLGLKLLSKRPLLYEIEDFLSADEADHIVAEASRRGLRRSATDGGGIASGVRLMDLDYDKALSITEMRRTLEFNFDAHFTEIDVRKMYDDLKLDPNGDDIVTAEELQQALPNYLPFEQYVKQLMEERGSLKGRHSENMFFFPNTETDGIIQRVTERVAQVVGVSGTLINKSDIQIVHYPTGGHYNVHLDSSPQPPTHDKIPCCTRFRNPTKCRSCRWATLLFYLNDVIEGGETAFPVADDPDFDAIKFSNEFRGNLHVECDSESIRLKVAPKKGRAVLWYNHLPAKEGDHPWFGEVDEYSRHGSCPVKQGEKWIANFWIKVTEDKDWDLSEQK